MDACLIALAAVPFAQKLQVSDSAPRIVEQHKELGEIDFHPQQKRFCQIPLDQSA